MNIKTQDPDLWPTWRDAATQPVIDAALRDLYQRLDDAIAARGPTCWQSGKCCHFDAYGHLLYVTGLEIAWFLEQGPGGPGAEQGTGVRDQGSGERPRGHNMTSIALPLIPGPRSLDPLPPACPYQQDNRCTTHAIRPLGCRVFFCQEGTQDWQQELYEQFLDELRDLHDAHRLEYRYMEWRAGLRDAAACGLAPASAPRP